jgi:FSR family fosmidomycin resistance protein-like MFS transporter
MPTVSKLFTEALNPLIPFLLHRGSLTPIFVLALAAIPGVLMMALSLPGSRAHRETHPSHEGASTGKTRASIPWGAFAVLGVMVALRSLAQPGSVTFIPVLFKDKGWDPAEYGLITGSFWIASGLAGVLFGHLADRYDRRYMVAASLFLSAPPLFFLPLSDGALAFALAIAAGGLSGASHSIIVVLAQELMPASKGLASGAILGFIFGTGALGSLVIGGLGDLITLGTTFQVVSGLTVLASLLGLALPAHTPPASWSPRAPR